MKQRPDHRLTRGLNRLSRAFRRLEDKTQVFTPSLSDHFRNRLTHTLEVAQIGRTLARALGANEDLTEAVCLVHDIGHPPFGHSGEIALSRLMQDHGGFDHNKQSLRIVTELEQRYADFPGLNLTWEVREGILKHTTWKRDFPFPISDPEGLHLGSGCHLEGQAVGWADEIAQQTHDLEDGLYAEAVSLEEVEKLEAAMTVIQHSGETYSRERRRWRRAALLQRGLIHLFVTDAIQATAHNVERVAGKHKVADHAEWLAIADQIPAATATMPRTKLAPIRSPTSTLASVAAAIGLTVMVLATRVGVVPSRAYTQR